MKIKLQSVKANYQMKRVGNACKSSEIIAIIKGERDKGPKVEERFALYYVIMV